MRIVIVLDCVDADTLADFWTSALGYHRSPFQSPYVRLDDPNKRWPDLLLQQVPERKSGKNRMHLDLQVIDVHAEVERLVAAGASVADPAHDDDGFLTAILADPEGNEFCVIRPPVGDERLKEI
jgi:hypothetical protein